MNDKRKNRRVPEKADVTIIVKSAPQARDLEGRIFPSSSVDISLSGLQLTVETDVPVGAGLELKVMFSHLTLEYWHRGVVIWNDKHTADSNAEADHTIGIKIDTMEEGRFYSWYSAIKELFDRHA
jgi:hypothetical protein